MNSNIDTDKIKVVAFDCDGVMFDSKDVNKMYYNIILKHFDMPSLTEDQFWLVHMFTVKDAIRFLFNDDKKYKEAMEFRKTIKYPTLLKYLIEEPYLKKLLKNLQNDYKIAIATNRTDTMHIILKDFQLEVFFDFVVTAQDVEKPKPHPAQLHLIMNQFNIKPDEMIFIGDSKADFMAAREAKVPFVGFNFKKSKEFEPDFTIDKLKDVNKILNLKNSKTGFLKKFF